MKSFKDYVKDADKQYKYTVKIAGSELSSQSEKCVLEALGHVDLIASDKMFTSPLMENPLDFPNIKNVAVNVMDFTIKYPMTTDVLERVVSEALGIQRNAVVVYAENDPRRVYTQQYLEGKSEDFKKKYKTKLGSTYEDEKPEKVELYGEKYNSKLLGYLAKEKKKRKDTTVVNALNPKQTTDNLGYTGEDMGPIGTASPITGFKK